MSDDPSKLQDSTDFKPNVTDRRSYLRGIATAGVLGAGLVGTTSSAAAGESKDGTRKSHATVTLEAVCYKKRRVSDGDLTVDPAEPGATATYTATLTVGSDVDGDSLNEIEADFSGTGVDVSDVEDQHVAVERNGTDVTDDLDEVSVSNDGETLTLTFGGDYDLEEGDELLVELENVQNPDDADDYEAVYTINDTEETEFEFTIGEGADRARKVKFRVYNDSKKHVKLVWKEIDHKKDGKKKNGENDGDSQSGTLKVLAQGIEEFWVDGTPAVALFDKKTGKQLDLARGDTETGCGDGDETIQLQGVCYRPSKKGKGYPDRALFHVRNYTDEDETVHWKVRGGTRSGTLHLYANRTRKLWVPLTGKKTRVDLYSGGEKIATAEANTDVRCGDHDGKDHGGKDRDGKDHGGKDHDGKKDGKRN